MMLVPLLLTIGSLTSAGPIERRQTSACTFGAYQCSGQILQQCAYGSGNTLSWSNAQTCGTGTICTVSGYVGCIAGVAPSPTPVATTASAPPSSSAIKTTTALISTASLAPTTSKKLTKTSVVPTSAPSTSASNTPTMTLASSTTAAVSKSPVPSSTTATAPATTSTPLPTLQASSAASFLPFAASTSLGSNIEGASVMCDGSFVAVGGTTAIRLDTGLVLVNGGNGQFASSRFLGKNAFLVGDASTHQVFQANLATTPATVGSIAAAALWPVTPAMIQPNDFTLNKNYTNMYLSGQRYTSTSTAGVDGELWYYNMKSKVLTQVAPSVLAAANIHRTNGIELSPDNSALYVTSAQNGPPTAAQIFKFTINPATGIPENPVVVIDLYKQLRSMGVNPQGMDPDGMKCDINGVIHVTMNGGGIVLRWNPATQVGHVIQLATVGNPSNLQFGGANGQRLVVIGHNCQGVFGNSCADYIDLDAPGREISDLQNSGNC
ncbi:hypothetical protein HDU98_000080 [Podochytrium sp. JEL0797]|nr:hypothetical protein HDU98_000080 [Podochytrium sp. JEL0797]